MIVLARARVSRAALTREGLEDAKAALRAWLREPVETRVSLGERASVRISPDPEGLVLGAGKHAATFALRSDTLAAIGRSAGGGWDIDLIADAYRAQMGERLAKLKGAKLIASWTGFCESFLARRGRP